MMELTQEQSRMERPLARRTFLDGSAWPGPPNWMVGRELIRFGMDPLGALEHWATLGDRVRIPFPRADFYLLHHPDDLEEVFRQRSDVMIKDVYARILKRVLGDGLVTSEGALWKRQRGLCAHAFTPKRTLQYAEGMGRLAERMVDEWAPDDVVDIHHEMFRVALDVVSESLFGADVTGDARAVGEAAEDLASYFANSAELFLGVPEWVPTPRHRRFKASMRTVDRIIARFVRDRRKAGASGAAGADRGDLLSALLEARDAEGGMSDQLLRDELVTMFVAGHETTAVTLANAFYLLSLHPAVLAAVEEEIDAVVGASVPTAEHAKRLTLTENVVRETLRLYPTVWASGREVVESYSVGGLEVPAGGQIMMPQWVVQRDPRFYDEPLRFRPERWTKEMRRALPRYAYFPFGGGHRTCIGNHFAMLESTLILAAVMRRRRLELVPGQALRFDPGITLRPKKTLKMRAVVR